MICWTLGIKPVSAISFTLKTSYINLGTFVKELEVFIINLEDGIEEGQSGKALKQGSKGLVYLLLGQLLPLLKHSPHREVNFWYSKLLLSNPPRPNPHIIMLHRRWVLSEKLSLFLLFGADKY
jgi:hypothetical protein